MDDFKSCLSGRFPSNDIRCVNDNYRFLQNWPRHSDFYPKFRCYIWLWLAPSDPRFYMGKGKSKTLIAPSSPKEEFLIDMETKETVISRAIALSLKLPLSTAQMKTIRVENKRLLVHKSYIAIGIGRNWEEIPCFVPCSNQEISCNVLGLNGLVSECLFCFSKNEFNLFRLYGDSNNRISNNGNLFM